MHELLFIAYDFPPCRNVGGSIRSEKFVKYLPQFGWRTRVISITEDTNRKMERYPHLDRVFSLTPFNHPLNIAPYGWIPNLLYQGRRIVSKKKYDLIYVSCPPFPQTIAALGIKRLAGRIPLVIDFRDAWTLGPYMETNFINKLLNRTLFSFIEKRILQSTDWLILNTPSAYREYIGKFSRYLGDKVSMIPNGYDEDDFSCYAPSVGADQMQLLYCGRLGQAERNPINLLEAVKQLAGEQLRISLSIAGDYHPDFPTVIEQIGVGDKISLTGYLPHNEAINRMACADVLIILQAPSNVNITPIAGKTYEYLRSGKAILAAVPSGDNLDIIRKYAFRFEAPAPESVDEISKAIRSLYKDWERGNLASYVPPSEHFNQYSRKNLTMRLASVFDHLITKG